MDFGLAAVEGRPRSHPSLPWPVAWASTAASREAGATTHEQAKGACHVTTSETPGIGTGLAAPGYTRPDGPDASFGQSGQGIGHAGSPRGVGETGRGVRTGMGPVPRHRSGAGRPAKLDKEDTSMPARPRQTAHVCELIELADGSAERTEDAATRTHRLLLVSWANDGAICEQEFAAILAAATETTTFASATVTHTGAGVTVAAEVDTTITAGLSLIHNGYSPRSQRLIGELNVVEVDFRGSDPDDPSDDGAALKAA